LDRPNFADNWNKKPLLTGFFIAASIYGSWQFSPTRALWDSLDKTAFFFLNGLLVNNQTQQVFWGIANSRFFDLIPGALLLLLFYYFAISQKRQYLDTRLRQISCFLVITPTLLFLLNAWIELPRLSPSQVLEPTLRLTEIAPWAHPKDASNNSFPGGHAVILFLCAGYLWRRGGHRFGLASLAISLLFILPRMVAGAHWFSDVFVGSLVTSITALSILLYTPIEGYVDQMLLNIRTKIFVLLKINTHPESR